MASIRRLLSMMVPVILCAFLQWTSAEAGAAGAKVKKVRLAYAGWEVGTAIAYVGIDAGIFKKYEVDVEEVFIRDALTGGVQSLIGVDFVLGFGSPIAILQPVLEGADIVFVGSHVSVDKYGMAVASDIATVKELKGKKIGVSVLGGRSDLVARVILRRAGLDPLKDVEIVAAGLAPNRMAALSNALIQGAPLNLQMASEAKRLGLKVLDVKDVPMLTALLMTTRSFVKRDEEAVKRFIKGYVAAIHFYLSHRAESIAIIKKYFTATDPGTLETMYNAFASQLRPIPGPNREAVQAFIDAASVADSRAKNIKPADLFEPRFLEELKGFIDNLYTEKVSL
ncbi:MAG: ABC transporter substrate-binding protein [Candidatus Binatia bacterium]